jgi:hypothetical protein
VRSREIGTLEPLLEGHDGIEIAAAALRLLENERSLRRAPQPAAVPEREIPVRREGRFDRPRGAAHPRRGDRDDRGPTRDRSARDKPRGGRDRDQRPDWKGAPRPPRKRGE